MKRLTTLAALLLALGCNSPNEPDPVEPAGGLAAADAGGDAETPVFSLAWSEYPSWSVFGVAEEKGFLNGAEGELGSFEEKHGVDVVLKGVDYDTCLQSYGAGDIDAVCITNIDILPAAQSIGSVVILPTSTSAGADACIAVGIDDVEGLKGVQTFGLEKSVSQYAFERCLTKRGLDPSEFPFRNLDPGEAAKAMQTGDENVKSIMVWNPFVIQTLRDRPESKRLFDSSEIPEEIIDMVVVTQEALGREKGGAFAACVCEAFYAVNDLIAEGGETGDETLVMLGEKFSSLELEDMKQVVQETKMYATPAEGLKLFKNETFQRETMPAVVKFCVDQELVEAAPKVGHDNENAALNFDPQFMKAVQ